MTSAYATGTSVTVEKTRTELDTLLGKHGATSRAIGTNEGKAIVAFVIGGLSYKLEVPMPEGGKPRVEPRGWWQWNESQRNAWMSKRDAQAARERWRALLLLVKAKLEAVRLGVSSVEKEFLADLILDDGRSVYQAMGARIQHALTNHRMPELPA